MASADQVDLLARACAATQGIVEHVSSEQLELPTPCADWFVRDLIEHVVGAVGFFADIAGAAPEEGDSFRRVVAGFSAPGAMERVMALPTGPAPGSRCIEVATGEIFVHGWDLATATATGRPVTSDDGVAEALLSSAWPALCAEVREADPSVFTPAIDIPRDAPATDRLVAFLGRDPSWQ
ncbi:MAG TPA: maleylpyruvate isomerase family mycothiol-dependent enzyme [Pseudonocardiaceae bacterium]|jgi:uncharacterized protein (TIGR03083 family)